MPGYNPNTNNLGFGGSPVSGITQFGGAEDWSTPATDKAANAIASAQSALTGTTNTAQGTIEHPGFAGQSIPGDQSKTTQTPPVNTFDPNTGNFGIPTPGTGFTTTPAITTPTPDQSAATAAYYAKFNTAPENNIAQWAPGGAAYQARMDEQLHYNDPANVAARAAALAADPGMYDRQTQAALQAQGADNLRRYNLHVYDNMVANGIGDQYGTLMQQYANIGGTAAPQG